MKNIATLALALLVSLGGCNSSAAALPTLSVSNPAANAPTLADLAARLCLSASADPNEFAAAIHATGWPSRKARSAGDDLTPAVWQLPHMTLIHTERPIAAPDADVWTCSLFADRAVAPPAKLLSRMLVHRLVGGATWSRSPLGLHWQLSLLTQADMDLGRSDTGGLGVTIEYAQVKPFRAVFGR